MDTHAQFLAALAAAAPKAIELSKTDEATQASTFRYKATEADNEAAASAYLAKAAELGVEPRFWIGSSERYNRGHGIFFSMIHRAGMQRSLKLMLARGASIWASRIDDAGKAVFTDPDTVAQSIFPADTRSAAPLGSRKAALAGALNGLPDLPSAMKADFIEKLCAKYKASTSTSSATSAGVMGRGDKRAKESSEIALGKAAEILAAAGQASPEIHAQAQKMLADAAARLEAKSRKGAEAFDPEKLKKSLTPKQIERMSTLAHLAESCAEDGEAMRALMDATPWLREHPQALCVNFRSRRSLASIALTCARGETLEALDRFGSNLWLASAQGGEGNACLWAADLLSRRRHRAAPTEIARMRAMVATTAKLLAYGAFLDGAQDPVAHAMAKADEAIKTAQGRRYGSAEAVAMLGELRGRMEALALSDLLAGRDGQGSGGDGKGQGGEGAPPARRSRSL